MFSLMDIVELEEVRQKRSYAWDGIANPYLQAAADIDNTAIYEALRKYKLIKMDTNDQAGLPEKTTGLSFNEAMKAMHSGFKIRLPEWTGYWFVNSGEMSLLTRTGDLLNTPDFKKFGDRDDWEIALNGMGFDFAILALNAGKLLTRASMTGRMIFKRPEHVMTVGYALTTDQSLPLNLKSWLKVKDADTKRNLGVGAPDSATTPIKLSAYLCSIDANRNITNGWVPTQEDLWATDWEVIHVPEWGKTPAYNKFDSQEA
jgi:Protein of unknown function (DUF2829)